MADVPARLYGVNQAAQYLGIKRSLTYELLASGELESVRIASRRLIPVEVLDQYIARLRELTAAQ